jgi:hypothetical protein
MPSGVGTKKAKVSNRKGKREDREIPELHHKVALRAYQLFEGRGRAHGKDLEDWFRAEQEMLSERMDSDLG